MSAPLCRGDRICWAGCFGYVGTVLRVVRGVESAHYCRLALDDGRVLLIGPETDTAPLSLIWSGRGNLRLISA